MNFKNFKNRWNTAENYKDTELVITKKCDFPGCTNRGEFKAPKSRYNLNDYYWFCLEHIQEYNSNWDYFKGMSDAEIENHINQSILGDRPTWKVSDFLNNEDRLKDNIRKSFSDSESAFQDFTFKGEATDGNSAENFDINHLPNTAVEALKIMGLTPPVEWKHIRNTYKSLVKKYHPDRNGGSIESQDKLKQINLSYSILKISYQKFETFLKD